MTRLSIQGVGCLTPWGNDVLSLMKKLNSNEKNENHMYVQDFEPTLFFKYKGLKHLSKSTKMAISSTWLALNDCKDDFTEWNKEKVGVFVGSSISYLNEIYNFLDVVYEDGPEYVSPKRFPNTVLNNIPGWVSIVFGVKGINYALQNGTTSAIDALELASIYLDNGTIDRAIIIGVEEVGSPVIESMNSSYIPSFISESSVSLVLSREEVSTQYGYIDVETINSWQEYEYDEERYTNKLRFSLKNYQNTDLNYVIYGSGNSLDGVTNKVLDKLENKINVCEKIGNMLSVMPLTKILISTQHKGKNLIIETNYLGNKSMLIVESKGGNE